MSSLTIIDQCGFTEPNVRHRLSARDEANNEIGHVYLYLIYNDAHRPRPYALVEELAVLDAHQGKGVARKLMEELHKLARAHNCYKIIANSHAKRKAARALYASLGYNTHATEFRLDL